MTAYIADKALYGTAYLEKFLNVDKEQNHF